MPYIPTEATSLNIEETPLLRLAIQAPSGRGKTFSGLTFPNVVVALFDTNIQAFTGREDIHKVDFWKDSFVDSIIKKRGDSRDGQAPSNPLCRPNKRDAFTKWLNINGPKFTPDQTFFLDSWTRLQDGFDQQIDYEPTYSKDGSVNDFAPWQSKIEYSREVLDLLNSLNCHVIVSFHEQSVTDKKGQVIQDKVQPFMQGKFVNSLGTYFGDWFRCWFWSKGTELSKLPPPVIELFNLKGSRLEEDLGAWQTKSDTYGDCKTRIPNCPQFIKADYKTLIDLYNKNKTSKT